MVKIAVAGAEGRMGRLITDLILKDPETELAAKVTRPKASEGGWRGVNVPMDVFIDFSHKDAVLEHLKICRQRKVPMVIGVTGLNDEQKKEIENAAKILPILMSPNMSVGANIVFKLLSLTGKILQKHLSLDATHTDDLSRDTSTNNPANAIDIAITEIHHRHKKDAPSGTAKYMGEAIQQEFNKKVPIQFSSLRMGEVMGDHRALFALEGEQLEIIHKAEERIIFAKGALTAAKWLYKKGQVPGLYSMQDVLSL